MAKDNTWIWIVLAVVVVGSIAAGSPGKLIDNVKGMFHSDNSAATPTGDDLAIACPYDGTDMTLGPARKKFSPGTSTGTIYDRLYVNGANRGLKTDNSATPTEVTAGDNVKIVYAENSSSYYANVQEFEVPCKASFNTRDEGIAESDMADIVYEATPVITVFNYDDGLENTDANNETVSTSDTATPRLRIDFPAKQGFSPNGEIALIAKYKVAAWDKSETVASSSDTNLVECSTPSIASDELAASTYTLDAWCFPGVAASGSTTYDVNVQMTSDDSTAASDVLFYLYDQDYYMNTDTEVMELDWQNNDDEDIGVTSDITATWYVN